METTGITDCIISYETLARTLVKSVFYRVLSLIGTVILSWIITKDLNETISITIAIQVFLIILYFVYERLWNRIKWGKGFDTVKGDAKLAKVRIEYYI